MQSNIENWKNLGLLVQDASDRFKDKTLFIFDGQSYSFFEINKKVNQAANSLKSSGVCKGDHVAVMLPNGVDFPLFWFALAKLGAVIVAVNINYHDHDLLYTLNDSQAKIFIIHVDFLHQWERVQDSHNTIEQVKVIGGAPDHWNDLSTEILQCSTIFEMENIESSEILNIQYTSGTTGFPKGCMLPHRYWLLMGTLATKHLSVTSDDVNLTAQPFYYMDPQWNTVICLMNGIPLVILPRFSPSHFWQAVHDHNVTFLYLIGTMPFFLLKMPEDEFDLSHHLRLILCSGIHPRFHAEFERRWGVPWREAFGMTETGVDLLVPVDDIESIGSGAMGLPVSTKKAMVVDTEGHEILDGKVGELVVQGEPMMLGYWNNPKATAETLINGWLHTGDLVTKDKKGYFYWQSRLKDTIRRAGENISTGEVESVLLEHKGIKAAAVLPVPDELRGEEVKAYIVLKPEQITDPESILDFAREQLAYFKVPRYIEFVDDLPRTASERVEKHKLIKAKPDLRMGSYDAIEKKWR